MKSGFWRSLRKIRSIKLKSFIGVVIVFGILYIFLFAGNSIFHTLSLRDEVILAEAYNDSLSKINEKKKETIIKLKKGDQRTLEEVARDQNLAREGETIVRIEEEED